MKLYGLIGFPLSHSFSPGYFNEKFQQEGIDASYRIFPLENIALFPTLIRESRFSGLNVTIPYKEQVIPFLDRLDAVAEAIGAVNCIRLESDGSTTGFNTDAPGFLQSIAPLLLPHHEAALILGTGGASKAVAYALQRQGLDTTFVSRKAGANAISYEDLDHAVLERHTVIVNTTPLGMYPNTEHAAAIPYQLLGEQHLLYDVVYNPERSLFLQKGAAAGATVKNGYQMLINQAEGSWEIWNR